MGIHASPTCSMALGGKGNCRGLLLGDPCQGMKIMFYMMNEARLGVGFQAFAYASTAYLYALNYARERIQGRDLSAGKDASAPSVPIIQHPDEPSLSHPGGMNEGEYATRLGLPGIPAAAEIIMVERDIRLAELTGGHLHLAHLSTAKSVDAVRSAKARGVTLAKVR